MQVEISEENFKFLTEFMTELNTQENLGTRLPIRLELRVKERVSVWAGCENDLRTYIRFGTK